MCISDRISEHTCATAARWRSRTCVPHLHLTGIWLDWELSLQGVETEPQSTWEAILAQTSEFLGGAESGVTGGSEDKGFQSCGCVEIKGTHALYRVSSFCPREHSIPEGAHLHSLPSSPGPPGGGEPGCSHQETQGHCRDGGEIHHQHAQRHHSPDAKDPGAATGCKRYRLSRRFSTETVGSL